MTESRNHGTTESRNHGTTEGQGESSIAPLFQSGAITIRSLVQSLKCFHHVTTKGSFDEQIAVSP